MSHSQDVGKDADRPHVGVEAHRFDLGDLWRRELGSGGCHFGDFGRIEFGGEAEVDQLDVGGFRGLADDILGLGRQRGEVSAR